MRTKTNSGLMPRRKAKPAAPSGLAGLLAKLPAKPAAALVVAGAGAVLGRKQLQKRKSNEGEGHTFPPGEPWTCACGAEYRGTGQGRHRVFWPAASGPADPVIGRSCVDCGRELPG